MDPLSDDYLLDQAPGGIIATPVELTDAQLDEWRQRWHHQQWFDTTIVADDLGIGFDP